MRRIPRPTRRPVRCRSLKVLRSPRAPLPPARPPRAPAPPARPPRAPAPPARPPRAPAPPARRPPRAPASAGAAASGSSSAGAVSGSGGAAAGAVPVTRPCSATCCSAIASPPINAFSPRTRPVSGAAMVPTSCAWSTSREGRRAIERTSSALSTLPSSRPPLNSRMWSARAVSLSALAAIAASPRTSVSAVGPWSISLSSAAPALSAARSESEFLTTRKLASASRSLARSSATWGTLMPR